MFACRLFFSLEKHKEQNVTIIYCLLRIGVKGVVFVRIARYSRIVTSGAL